MAMEMFQKEKDHECKKSRRWRSRAKLCLEEYLHLLDSPRIYLDLPVNHLNQIISMHGFKKLHKVPKKALTDAVSTLALVNPSRSTLNDRLVSPVVSATLEDVIADLSELNWQECSTTSIKTLNSGSQSSSGSLVITSSSTPMDLNKHYEADRSDDQPPQPCRREALKAIGNNGGFSAPKGAIQKVRRAKKVPKRKRSIAPTNCDCNDRENFLALDFVSL